MRKPEELIDPAEWLAGQDTPLTKAGIVTEMNHVGRSTIRLMQEGHVETLIHVAMHLGLGSRGVSSAKLLALMALAQHTQLDRADLARDKAPGIASRMLRCHAQREVVYGEIAIVSGRTQFTFPIQPDGLVHEWLGPEFAPTELVLNGPILFGFVHLELADSPEGHRHSVCTIPAVEPGGRLVLPCDVGIAFRSAAFVSRELAARARDAHPAVAGPLTLTAKHRARKTPSPVVKVNNSIAYPGDSPEPGPVIAVPCTREGCGHVTRYPIGEPVAEQLACAHAFTFDIRAGRMGHFVCRCGVRVSAETLYDAGKQPEARYTHDGNTLADAAQRVRDENRNLLVENAQLRRELDALKRKGTK